MKIPAYGEAFPAGGTWRKCGSLPSCVIPKHGAAQPGEGSRADLNPFGLLARSTGQRRALRLECSPPDPLRLRSGQALASLEKARGFGMTQAIYGPLQKPGYAAANCAASVRW